jgi:DNA-binding transcriptional MerR regulator
MPGLTNKQQRAIESLLTAPTIKAAAEIAGVHERTLRKWLQDGTFKAAFTEARHEVFDRTITRIQATADRAIDAIDTVLSDASSKPGLKLRAASIVLKLVVDLRGDDIGERMAELERLMQEKNL